jgi:hypothetical protein
MIMIIAAFAALGLFSFTSVRADDALNLWDWFPDISAEPPYVTGRRRRSLLRGEDPNDYASLVATTKDSDGVTWPCVVNPFQGVMWRLKPTLGEEAQEMEMPTCRQVSAAWACAICIPNTFLYVGYTSFNVSNCGSVALLQLY